MLPIPPLKIKATAAEIPSGLLFLPVAEAVIRVAWVFASETIMAGAIIAHEVPPVGGDPAVFAMSLTTELGRGPADFGFDSRNTGLGLRN